MKFLAILLAFTLLSGCALVTKPTGLITIERQEFINTYAVVKVLYKRMVEDATSRCEGDAVCLARVADTDSKARALDIQIQAKIEVPESEIDWVVVKDILKTLVSLVP